MPFTRCDLRQRLLVAVCCIFVLAAAEHSEAADPIDSAEPAVADAAGESATINGKYAGLLHKLHVPADKATYSGDPVYDYGWWGSNSYAGYDNLQHGYWVWVDPHWYVFAQLGDQPLHFAAQHGHVAVVQRLLKQDRSLAQQKNAHGKTAFELAVAAQQYAIVQAMAEHVTVKNFAIAGGSSTFLHHMAALGLSEIVGKLVSAGADLTATDSNGCTPLQVAVKANQLLVADVLVNEVTVDQLEIPAGSSKLHWATDNGMVRTVAELIAAGEDVNVKDQDGLTALHIAAFNGHAPMVKLLIENKADVNVVDGVTGQVSSEQTPLHAAAEAGHTSVAALLLAAHAKASPRDNSNYTPLHAAAWNNHPHTVMLLLHHGAEVDARTDDAETPLHKAAWRGHAQVVIALLAHGADRRAKDNFDLTPLDKANSDIERLKHKQPVVDLLNAE